ncbi:hypothetical protein [Mechercharimyces sp. CAU 1602]|uniref:hypothetical protein n=1 Tax=Mechercharimyces sp. CAU 1602 TaxID=2973933 RepID=UPI0021634CB0|nr:hypothetical protein [Mechercharimyces sp. CAU 1602]MCS1352045.1 hypothetical protein [Mechercharimyces sp. CAU 1602]
MMVVLYALIVVFMIIGGISYLTVNPQPMFAVHYFSIALYFFVLIFEFIGKPFSRPIYLLLTAVLMGNALIQFFYADESNYLMGIISLFFAFFSLQAQRRLRKSDD